jgi:hypothetical protein
MAAMEELVHSHQFLEHQLTMLAVVVVVALEAQTVLEELEVEEMLVLLVLQEQLIGVVVVEQLVPLVVLVSSSFLFLKLNLQSTHIFSQHQANGQHHQELLRLIMFLLQVVDQEDIGQVAVLVLVGID